jgi:cytochrome b561
MSTKAMAFSRTSIVLHWLVAAGIGGMIGFGLWVGSMESGPEKTAAIQLHKSFGIMVGSLALIRLVWRFREGFPVPIGRTVPAWEVALARRAHEGMLFLTVVIPATGVLKSVTYARPVEVFGMPFIPNLLAEKHTALNEAVSLAHTAFAYTLAAIIFIHVVAAAKHHLVDRDRTMWRILSSTPRARADRRGL